MGVAILLTPLLKALRIALTLSLLAQHRLASSAQKSFQHRTILKVISAIKLLCNAKILTHIDIANTHEKHFKTIAQCLTHNKHVLSEKPITVNAQQLESLTELAKQKNCRAF